MSLTTGEREASSSYFLALHSFGGPHSSFGWGVVENLDGT